MTRTHADSHDRSRTLDVGAFAYSDEESAWVGTLGDVQVYLPGSPKLGVSRTLLTLSDGVLGQLQRTVAVAREALMEEVADTERGDWQCVEVRFFEEDAKKNFTMTFVMTSEAGAEWDVWFLDQKPVSVRRKIALW